MRSPRTNVVLMALALTVGTSVAALAAPRADRDRARLGDYFSEADLERARRYRGPRYALGFAALGVGLATVAALGLGPGARGLGRWSQSAAGGRWVLEALLLVAVVTLAGTLAELPLSLARNLYHDRAWGLSVQTLGGFLGDVAKGAGFQVGVAAVTALGFFGIVRGLPRAWPAVTALFAAGLTVFLVYVYPVIYEPLFNRFAPAEAGVRERVLGIAGRAGVEVGDVLVADASRRTRRQNAYVSGLGATKRVVLYDTLLEGSTPAEVDLIVAHELAHVAHRDVLKGTALLAGGAAGAALLIWGLLSSPGLRSWLGVAGAGDPRSIPFLAFVLAAASLLALPLQNWFSRSIEGSADRAAIEYTRNPDTAVAVEVNLARANLADLEPNGFIRWVFFTHPTVLERIQIALDWKVAHGPRTALSGG